MGLDIYSGTLTRYYTGDWKTIVQQWAEANGMQFSKITPNSGETEGPSDDEIAQAVNNWVAVITTGLSNDEITFSPWSEDSALSYYTNKPDWDALGALLLYTACKIEEKPVPAQVEKGWDFMTNPIINKVREIPGCPWSLFAAGEIWLPLSGSFYFQYQDIYGNPKTFGTVDGLAKELEKINAMGWNADEETILNWSSTEGYPPDGEIVDGQYVNTGEHTAYDTESLAKFAYSILHQAVRFAQEHNTAIIMDY